MPRVLWQPLDKDPLEEINFHRVTDYDDGGDKQVACTISQLSWPKQHLLKTAVKGNNF